MTCPGCLCLSTIPHDGQHWCAHRVHYGWMDLLDGSHCGRQGFVQRGDVFAPHEQPETQNTSEIE